MRKVLIIDPKNIIRNGGDSVLLRHSMYRDSLIIQSSQKYELKIIDQNEIYAPVHSLSRDRKSVPQKKGSIIFVWRLIKVLKNDKSIDLLVAGDPWLSAIASIVAKKISKSKLSIQIQVHGDFGNKKWKLKSPKNLIKYVCAHITLKYADNIRCVGLTQSINLSNAFSIDPARISIVPVQLSIAGETLNSKEFDIKNVMIGFVGRIHRERSYGELVTILRALYAEEFFFSLTVIGEGPGLAKFTEAIRNNLPRVQVRYVGWLEGEDLAREFRKIDVLISTADFEAYGRSIREADFLGIAVLAIKSSGVLDAARESSTGLIHTLDSPIENEKVIHEFKNILSTLQDKHKTEFKDIRIQENFQQNIPKNLAQLWIRLGERR